MRYPVTNWWVSANTGLNQLKGVEGDPQNPILTPDWLILDLLADSNEAVAAFWEILPVMLPEEQERLRALVVANPFVVNVESRPLPEPLQSDAIQHRQFKRPVWVAGRYGGGAG